MIYFVKRSIIDLIGRTPVVKFSQNKDVQVLIKLGGMNPSGSIKDVPVLSMIKDAESKGILKKGDTIIESTSGNTGISLAMIGAVRGYKVVLVMPENVSIERIKILRYYGARLIFTPASEGSDGAIKKVRELAGATDPKEAKKGTIRSDYGLFITCNSLHACSSKEDFEREASVFFSKEEIYDYEYVDKEWFNRFL